MISLRIAGMSAAFVLVAALAAVYLTRPAARVISNADPDVTIECAATTGVGTDHCLGWGDAIIEQGPPSFTFEMDALTRLEIDRPLLGLSLVCNVAYFTPRYPEDAVWTEEIFCVEAR